MVDNRIQCAAEASEGRFGLSSPWNIYAREVEALFARDPEVGVEYDDEAPCLRLLVEGEAKALALSALMPSDVKFGGVTLPVDVVSANGDLTELVFKTAFEGNPVFCGMDKNPLVDGTCVSFALFAPEVAQYFADDISNPFGLQTRTYEQVVTDVLCASGPFSRAARITSAPVRTPAVE